MTVLESEIPDLVAVAYGFGTPDRCRMVHGGFGVNDTYALDIDGSRYALRIQPVPSMTSRKHWISGESDLRFELELLMHLHRHDIRVSYPLPQRNGDLLGRFEGVSGDSFYTLFSWAPGDSVDVERLSGKQAYRVGETLAALHLAADRFEITHSRYSLDEKALLDRPLSQLEPSFAHIPPLEVQLIKDHMEEVRARLRAFVPGPDEWGIIHGDIQALNYHVTDDEQIILFDFDLCGYGWRAYDLAYYYTRVPASVRPSVLCGYQARRPLGHVERDMLSTFGRAAWIWEGLTPQELVLRLRNPYV